MKNTILAVVKKDIVDVHQIFESFPQQERLHNLAVGELTAKILSLAAVQGLTDYTDEQIAMIGRAAVYHNIGFALIPERLLYKVEELTSAEFRVLQKHCQYGATILDNHAKQTIGAKEPLFFWPLAAEIALNHHERWDGQGYPFGQSTTAIPFEARAAAIADAYDRISRGSSYRMPLPSEYALLEIVQNSGKQFDPELTEVFRKHLINSINSTEL